MAIYAIGDLHLSLAAKKPMDIFSGWDGHAEKLIENWNKKIGGDDTIVLVGDTSWGMSLEQALADFRLIHSLPGKKIILKGNHDYWWASLSKMDSLLQKNNLDSIYFLHNNSYYVDGTHICGSRGWVFESGQPHDEKLIRREALRIEASLKSRGTQPGETILFLHYPPVYAGSVAENYIEIIHRYNIKRCYYGHIHGPGHQYAVQGKFRDIVFSMVSSDYIAFDPMLVSTQS